MSDVYSGSCFCGEVQFELTGAPEAMGYCHCSDCAAWAAAPINAFSLWSPEKVTVTKGEDNICTYNKTENSYRKSCKSCGGHLMTDHPGMKRVDVYANVVANFKHEPALHVFYGEKTVSVKDGLPKYKDMPAAFGGSDETLLE